MDSRPSEAPSAHMLIEARVPGRFGASVLGPVRFARAPDGRPLWVTAVDPTLIPRAEDRRALLAGAKGILHAGMIGTCDLWWLEEEHEICLIGYGAIPSARTLTSVLELPDAHVQALWVARSLAGSLAELHGRGQVHGLLTPDNIVTDGARWLTWQQGIAPWVVPERLAVRLQLSGGDETCPELGRTGVPTPASDVFGWGVAVAGLLTGVASAAAVELLETPFMADQPLAGLVRDCLREAPDARPQDALALRQRLAVVLAEPGTAVFVGRAARAGPGQSTAGIARGEGSFGPSKPVPADWADAEAVERASADEADGLAGDELLSKSGAGLEDDGELLLGSSSDSELLTSQEELLTSQEELLSGPSHPHWQDLARSYLHEDLSPSPSASGPARPREALARLNLVRARVPTPAVVQPAATSTTASASASENTSVTADAMVDARPVIGAFTMPDTPFAPPDPLPQSIPGAPALPLGSADHEPLAWESSVFQVDPELLALIPGPVEGTGLDTPPSEEDEPSDTPVDGFVPHRRSAAAEASLEASLENPVLEPLDGEPLAPAGDLPTTSSAPEPIVPRWSARSPGGGSKL